MDGRVVSPCNLCAGFTGSSNNVCGPLFSTNTAIKVAPNVTRKGDFRGDVCGLFRIAKITPFSWRRSHVAPNVGNDVSPFGTASIPQFFRTKNHVAADVMKQHVSFL